MTSERREVSNIIVNQLAESEISLVASLPDDWVADLIKVVEIDDRFIEIPSKGISQNIKHDWLIEIFKTPIKDLPPQISSWYNNLIEWLYNFEDQAIITTHFMVINALVSHLKNNNMIAYFNPGFASRTEIWMQNGILTKLILGKAKKTVLNF